MLLVGDKQLRRRAHELMYVRSCTCALMYLCAHVLVCSCTYMISHFCMLICTCGH